MRQLPYMLSVRGWKAYALGVLLVAATVGLGFAVRLFLHQVLYILLVPAVVATAWLAGLGPALLAALLSVLAVDWLFLPPHQGFALYQLDDLLALLAFITVAWPVAWLAGRVRHAVGSLHRRTEELEDRTEQLELARQEARARAREFRLLAENAPDLIARVDSDLRYVYVNRAIEEAAGESAERLAGEPVSELGPFRNIPAVLDALAAVAEKKEPAELEFRHRGATGERWYAVRLVPELDPRNGATTVLGIARDITDRRHAEERRKLLLEASRLFTTSLDPARTMDNIARLVARTLGAACLVDVPDSEGVPSRQALAAEDPELEEALRRFTADHPASAEPDHPIRTVLRTGEAVRAERLDEQLDRLASDPERRRRIEELGVGSFMIVPLPGREGTLGSLSILSRAGGRIYSEEDLALARELAARAGLALDNAALYEASKEEARFREEILAIVAHDLNNPLNVLRTTAHALRSGTESEEDRRRLFEAHERAVERADRLLRDLLDLSRIESGRFRIEPEVTEVETLLDHALEQTRLQSDPPPRWAVHVAPDCPPVAVDRGRLVQALCNLIDNAIRFSPESGLITLGAERRGDEVVLYLSDQGTGIDPSELPHVFKRFWRGETSTGSGLGLSIVKGIVDAHGGEVEVESRRGEGTTFRLLLPAGGVEGEPASEPESMRRSEAPADPPADAEVAP